MPGAAEQEMREQEKNLERVQRGSRRRQRLKNQ